ncbi:metal-dependent hydrolase [Planctomonas sp. JC2975]|uniref:metal-dependent hydrolase n=1 Tax=Planctomonas sp. JC2975 TaxID=2729626 RepID=UPI00147627A3|nr:metal-dependent hydrolase [Planctomonas sp. JC2975]NNC11344.1 metal-dependent hydrolase [Planctomonas sp. JC2975]
MMGAHHAVSGAAVWLAVTATAPAIPFVAGRVLPMSTGLDVQPPEVALLGALVVAGWALVADLDHHSATISRSVPVLGKLASEAVATASGGHRKGTHTVWAAVIAGLIAWAASLLVWDTHSPVGTLSVGLLLVTAPAIAFATHTIKSIKIISTWPRAWLVGVIGALAIDTGIRTSFGWLLLAVVLGYAVHLVGDFLTVEGIPPTYPWVPKPPHWWRRSALLGHFWHDNGYVSLPVLGRTGSKREWFLAVVLTLYVLYVVFFEVHALVNLHWRL